MGVGGSGLVSSTLRQKRRRPTDGRQRRAIGGNEHRADAECGSCESGGEHERRRVSRGQRSTTVAMMSADARGNIYQRGDTESRADLAGRIDQPTRESLLKIGDAAAACHSEQERDDVRGAERRQPEDAETHQRIPMAQLPGRERDQQDDGERGSTDAPDRNPTRDAPRHGHSVLAAPVSAAPAWFWRDRACPRLGTARRSVGARIIA